MTVRRVGALVVALALAFPSLARAQQDGICGDKVVVDGHLHCCWPGQQFSVERDDCVGVPTACPRGLVPTEAGCVESAETKAREAHAWHRVESGAVLSSVGAAAALAALTTFAVTFARAQQSSDYVGGGVAAAVLATGAVIQLAIGVPQIVSGVRELRAITSSQLSLAPTVSHGQLGALAAWSFTF